MLRGEHLSNSQPLFRAVDPSRTGLRVELEWRTCVELERWGEKRKKGAVRLKTCPIGEPGDLQQESRQQITHTVGEPPTIGEPVQYVVRKFQRVGNERSRQKGGIRIAGKDARRGGRARAKRLVQGEHL